jgi:hypothetical protein
VHVSGLPTPARARLEALAETLIDQDRARVLIPPLESGPGFWFGSGNMVEDDRGRLYLCGRYRNSGDSRTGLLAGARGAELAVFRSEDRGGHFTKIHSFSKSDLSYGDREVVSIERAWLYPTETGVELYVSTEKTGLPYPEGFESFRKPGTGVWSIDRITAPDIEALDPANIEALFEERDPRYCHLKDPMLYRDTRGNTVLMLSTHPYNWASSNTAVSLRSGGQESYGALDFGFFPRGFTWDVAISRICGVLPVPRIGAFADLPQTYLFFYDGGECMRNLQEHAEAIRRPRGYSCEELGGAAYTTEEEFPRIERLSATLPFFVSPHGTGCSRYATALLTEEGVYATWEQSQPDLSQPLVLHFTPREEVERILA